MKGVAPHETDGATTGISPIPQIDDSYESLEALIDALNAWGRSNGVGFAKKRTSNYKDGKPTYATLYCDRGFTRASQAKLRDTSTAKTDCPWSAVAKSLARNNRRWMLEIKCNDHNHEVRNSSIVHLATHSAHRGLTDAMKLEIEALSSNAAIRPRDIFSTFTKRFLDVPFMIKDITNYREQLQQTKLNGLTPTQALLEVFKKENVWHYVLYHPSDLNRIIGLFWTYDWCLQMWRRFPYAIQMDNTYKTNRFRMPFFEVTGVTNLSTNFNVAFGLIDNEREEGYEWLIQ